MHTQNFLIRQSSVLCFIACFIACIFALMIRPFVSVDLDYWKDSRFGADSVRFLDTLVKLAAANNRPMSGVVEHHFSLAYCDAAPGDGLVNIDFHSDLCDFDNWQTCVCKREETLKSLSLNCGTWVNHVAWANSGPFAWFYPEDRCFLSDSGPGGGRCEWDFAAGVWEPEKADVWQFLCGWGDLRHGCGLPVLRDLSGLSICLSPDYLQDAPDKKAIFRWFQKFLRHPNVSFNGAVEDMPDDGRDCLLVDGFSWDSLNQEFLRPEPRILVA